MAHRNVRGAHLQVHVAIAAGRRRQDSLLAERDDLVRRIKDKGWTFKPVAKTIL